MKNVKTNKVVTVTLNPALDLTGHMDLLRAGHVNLVEKGSLHAAGKGVNVAKVLTELGAQVTVTGFLGADNPELFHQLFSDLNVDDQFITVAGATRINVKLVENDGQVTDINFPGVQVSAEDIHRFESQLFELAQSHDFFVIAGSLPQGVTPEQCAKWIADLQAKGKKVFFDSSKAALQQGINATPWLIKPNDEELADLIGEQLQTSEQLMSVGRELANKGIANVVISRGADGVLWLRDGHWIQATPPKMELVSTVGAGDTLVAGLCWGEMQQMPAEQHLRFATALSALAVSQVGVGVPEQSMIDAASRQVILTRFR
ncbi:1-phosphofructokinase [Vibrio hippocampi]|uniref:Phosphofructokinase n=1 Tax=Vibrio hippocampi TaxID=654686 RepID=A0ABN8DPI8_9VIBR|nr:1-phosphofructokinase [Vibrio hippocampi]CAH0530154.1 Tagatose-6-phosphate kinase [Vibrio hippocampi]